MIHESLQLYTNALDEVRTALSSSPTETDDAMLVASRALAAYELLGSLDEVRAVHVSRARSWHSHNQGQGAIMTRRRPEDYMFGRAHQLFADSRVQLALASFMNKQKCFLAEPEWVHIPWTYIPKTAKDYMLDAMIQIPAMMEDLELWTRDNDFDAALRLRKAYVVVRKDLETWETEQLPAEELKDLRTRLSETPTPTDMVAAQLVSCFWTLKLITNNIMHVACLTSPELKAEPEWNESFSSTAQNELCRKIAEVVGVLLHPASGVFWGQYAMCPVAISLLYLTTTQQLGSETADRLLSSFSDQINPDALIRFVLGILKDWPGMRVSSLPALAKVEANREEQQERPTYVLV
jgi:hypothetical protein